MATVSAPAPFSASTDGRPVKVAATAIASGTTIHTAATGTTATDYLTMDFTNTDTSERTVTLGFGGVTDPDDLILKAFKLPAGCHVRLVRHLPLTNGLAVKAAASVANVVLVSGFYVRNTEDA